MIYFQKSQPAPTCLEDEKKKASGDYKCGDVLDRLHKDFHNKCYICEKKAPLSINVEHFISHQGDKELMFDWNNLFFACSHCNNSKLAGYDDILNCTTDTEIETKIDFLLNPYPKEIPILTSLSEDETTRNTVELLNKVYVGHTVLKKLESANLRDELLKEIRAFQNLLFDYIEIEEEEYKDKIKSKIISHLKPSSSFTAFKRRIIRNNSFFKQIFESYF